MTTTAIMTNANNLDNYSSALRRNQHKFYENIKLSPSPLFHHQQEDQGIYVDNDELGYNNIYNKNEIKHDDDDDDDDEDVEDVEPVDDCEEDEEEHDSIILDDAEIDKEIEIKVDDTDDKDLVDIENENGNEIENDLKTNSNDPNGNLDINTLNNNNNNNQFPHFEYVSYDKVQDLYEQKKGHFYFIPEGFEPVLVPNDTKAQTVTNLLESTKPVSAVPNVSRMLPDTDVRLPSYALPCGVNAAANAKKNDANNANANKASNKAKKPPRPPNAFILYRRAKQPAIVAKNVGISNNDVSKEIGKMWHEEPVEIKLKYQKMAEAAKEEHTKKYPEYRYRPRRPQERKRRLLTRGKDNVEGSEVGGKAAKRLRRSSAYVLAQRQTVINCNTNMDNNNMNMNMNMMMDNNIDNNFSNISNYNYNNHPDSNLYHQNSHPQYNHPHHQQLLAIQNQPQMYYHQQNQINTAPTTTSNTPSPPLHTNNSFSMIDNDVDNNNHFTTPTTTYPNDLMEYPIYNQHNQHNYNQHQHQRPQQNYIDFDSYNHSPQPSNFNNQFITKCNY
jgi:hypothetical protein